jgi:hypothetical protein
MQYNLRSLEDAANTVSQALPTSGNTVTSSSVELGIGRKAEGLALGVDVPAISGLASAATVTFTVLHSVDNATWVSVPDLGAQAVTGPSSGGSAAVLLRWSLPTLINQYVAIQAVASTSAGTITGNFLFKVFA